MIQGTYYKEWSSVLNREMGFFSFNRYILHIFIKIFKR